jgi:integrase
LFDAFLLHAAAKLKPTTVREYRRLLADTPIRRGLGKGKTRIGELRAALGRFKVADVTRAQISKLHLGMKDRPYAANRALATLSAAFKYAEQQGYRPEGSNPCRGIQEYRERKRERLLTDAEYANLGDAMRRAERVGLPLPVQRQRRKATEETAKHRTRSFDQPVPASPVGLAALRFLVLTGWRKREALTLKWTEVDLSRRSATLADSKTGRSDRELGAPAAALVDQMRKLRRDGNPYVFPGNRRGMHFTDITRIWDCVRSAAGLRDVRLHDLRHGYASVGLMSGLTLPVIGALLGHTDVSTTARYAHLADTARKRAADLTSEAVEAALSAKVASPLEREA